MKNELSVVCSVLQTAQNFLNLKIRWNLHGMQYTGIKLENDCLDCQKIVNKYNQNAVLDAIWKKWHLTTAFHEMHAGGCF